jgi:hypothetical protein
MESSSESEPHPLSITFVRYADSAAVTAEWNERRRNSRGSGTPAPYPVRIEALPGDYAILTITNHGGQFLRFDSVGVEFELNGAWVSVNPDKWWGLHGKGWITQSEVYLRCPAEVPRNARWRVRYVCDVDPDPTRPPHEVRADPVAPVLMVSPVLPARAQDS